MKTRKTRITIGIPAYNEEANIGMLLKNLLLQEKRTFMIDAIIVISDGSTDKTVEEVKKLKSKKIVLFEGKQRYGQSVRLNKIVHLMPKTTDCLLLLEADTLPAHKTYLQLLVDGIPASKKYSMVIGSALPLPATSSIGKIVNFGFLLRKEIFEHAAQQPNVYLFAESGLLSKEFVKTLHWEKDLNEDSYCYRQAIQSKLPIIRVKRAAKYFKSVDTLKDYLIQSGKFQKASENEKKHSSVFETNIQTFLLIKTIFRMFMRQPSLFIAYVTLVFFSRLYKHFLPPFHAHWETYTSTKKLSQNYA